MSAKQVFGTLLFRGPDLAWYGFISYEATKSQKLLLIKDARIIAIK